MSPLPAGSMRVIAVESFTDAGGEWHPYGHEFVMGDTPERAQLIQAGTIRKDDRMRKTRDAAALVEKAADAAPLKNAAQPEGTKT